MITQSILRIAAVFSAVIAVTVAFPHTTQAVVENLSRARTALEEGEGAGKVPMLLAGLEDELPELKEYILFLRANALRAAGFNGAAEMFVEAARAKPLEATALEEAAEQYEERGLTERAGEIYITLADSGAARDFHLKKAAEGAEQNGRNKQAADLWERLWREYPASGFSTLAQSRVAALRSVEFPLAADLEKRADALFEMKRWGTALAAYQSLPPGQKRDVRVAVCIYRTGGKIPARLKEALSLLEGAMSPEGLYAKGVVLERLGRSNQAVAAYRSVRGGKWEGKALMREQRLAMRRGDADGAAKIYKKVSGSHPSLRPDAAWNAAWSYYRSGNYGAAAEILSENTRDRGSYLGGQFRYWTARILEKRGRYEEARAIFEEVARGPFSYYSFLSSQKVSLKRGATEAEAEKENADGNTALRRARLLLEADLTDWARAEARIAARNSPVAACGVLADTGSFNFCIKLAGNNPPHGLARLAFPMGFEKEVKKFSAQEGLDEMLVYSVIREESRFMSNAVSHANAYGLMQLILPTAKEAAKAVGMKEDIKPENLFAPEVNIRLGSYYLSAMLRIFGGSTVSALAAYNAGPGRVKKWMIGELKDLEPDEFVESVPFNETKNYIRRILRSYGVYKVLYSS